MNPIQRLAGEEYRYPYLSPTELAERLSKKAVLYLPIGSLEWHNEHLPLGTDTFHAIELSRRLCERLGGVLLPAFWWNTGGCHDHACTYHMPESFYRAVLRAVICGLRAIPAKLLVLINGHGGGYQKDTPNLVAGELNRERFPIHVLVTDPYALGTSCPHRIDHADTNETSVAMELIPQLVRMDREIGPDLFSKEKPFQRGPATPRIGKEFCDAVLSDAAALIERTYAGL